MPNSRHYIQARNLRQEAEEKLKDYEAIMGRVWSDYRKLCDAGIECAAFGNDDNSKSHMVYVTRNCWNHVFKHPIKRQSKIEKLERALCLDLAIKLIKKRVNRGICVAETGTFAL